MARFLYSTLDSSQALPIIRNVLRIAAKMPEPDPEVSPMELPAMVGLMVLLVIFFS
jgi:hypothetical protein